MNNKEFINALATRLQENPKTVKQHVEALVDALANMLDEGATLNVQGFGTYEVKKKKERIIVHPITKQTPTSSPKTGYSIQAQSHAQRQSKRVISMEKKFQPQDLAALLAHQQGISTEEALNFVRAFFELTEEALVNDSLVKVTGFGTTKLVVVNERESVNIHTGERFQIGKHTKNHVYSRQYSA